MHRKFGLTRKYPKQLSDNLNRAWGAILTLTGRPTNFLIMEKNCWDKKSGAL